MSIGAMTHLARKRKQPTPVPMKAPDEDELGGAVPGTTAQAENAVTDALQVVMSYIPTEIISIYVVAVGVVIGGQAAASPISPWTLYYTCLAATPFVVWIVYATKYKAQEQALPVAPALWPKWEMVAAPTAFFAWAVALPDSPFQQCDWHTTGFGGLILVLVSTVLGLLGGLLKPASQPPTDA